MRHVAYAPELGRVGMDSEVEALCRKAARDLAVRDPRRDPLRRRQRNAQPDAARLCR